MANPFRIFAAGALLLVTTGSAFAAPAVALSAVNVRSGPGTNYAVIGTLSRGITVEVLSCTPAWCAIGWTRPAYVSAGYLGFDGPPPYVGGPPIVVQAVPAAPVAPPIVVAPPVAPLVYASPPPVLFYPPPPRFYGPPPAPGPYFGVGVWSW